MLEEHVTDGHPPHPICPTCGVQMWMVKIVHRDGPAYTDRLHYECKACGSNAVVPPLE